MTDPLDTPPLGLPGVSAVARRTERLRAAAIGEAPVEDFDRVAKALAERFDMPYAMVNFPGEDKQYFAGLYAADADAAIANSEAVGRTMPKDHGYCPEVVQRGTALPLGSVYDAPHFAGNPVVDLLDIRSYLGAPVTDDDGTVLGTVCVVGKEPRTWEVADVTAMKKVAEGVKVRVKERIRQRQRGQEELS